MLKPWYQLLPWKGIIAVRQNRREEYQEGTKKTLHYLKCTSFFAEITESVTIYRRYGGRAVVLPPGFG